MNIHLEEPNEYDIEHTCSICGTASQRQQGASWLLLLSWPGPWRTSA